jgi:hypothetical protein
MQCQAVHLQSFAANQPVPPRAEYDHVNYATDIRCWLTYVMLDIIKEVLQSLVSDIIHECTFLRCQGGAVFRICETCMDLAYRSEAHTCGHVENMSKWGRRH